MADQLSYPEVYIPNEITRISVAQPPLPEEPKEPQKPLYPTKPSKDQPGCLVLLALGGIVVAIYAISEKEAGVGGILFLVFFVFLGLLAFFIFKAEGASYKEKLAEYENQVRDYPQMLRQFEAEKKAYSHKKEQYQKQVEQLLSEESLNAFRARKIQEWKDSLSIDILDFDESDQVKEGLSEKYFANELAHKVDDYYLFLGKRNEIFSKPKLMQKVPAGNSFYYPDLVIKKDGLVIDVEIDEPYVGGEGTPIHYLEKNGYLTKSVDERRNVYMTDNDWIVIRFSEEQIFTKTEECIAFIMSVIHQIERGEQIIIPESLKTPKWTVEEAARMAYKHYRESYINNDRLQSINYYNPDGAIIQIDGLVFKKGRTQTLNAEEKKRIRSVYMKYSEDGIPQIEFYLVDGTARVFRAHWNVALYEGDDIHLDSVKLIEYKNHNTGRSIIIAYGSSPNDPECYNYYC